MEYETVIYDQQEYRQLLTRIVLSSLGDSTVLPIEEVENIKLSLDFVLKKGTGYNNLEQIYLNGLAVLTRELQQAREMYEKILLNYKDYGVEAIKGTIEGFNHFFTSYDLQLGAHLIPGVWIVYQLFQAIDSQKIKGLDFVMHYLDSFYIEMLFLNQIPDVNVLDVLQTYSQLLGFDYQIDVNNIYELLFNQVISKSFVTDNYFKGKTLVLSKYEAQFLLSNKANFFVSCKKIKFMQGQEYHQKALEKLTDKLTTINHLDSLGNFLVLTEEIGKKHLRFEPPMMAAQYIELSENIDHGASMAVIARKLISPYDIFSVYQDQLLTSKQFSHLILLLESSIFVSFVLWLNSENHSLWYSVEDILKENTTNDLLQAIRQRIDKNDLQEIQLLNDTLSAFSTEVDFF